MERLCFVMPQDPEIYLAAIAVLQAYCKDLATKEAATGVREALAVTVVTDPALQFLLDALPVPCRTLHSSAKLACPDFDLVFEFNAEAAYALGHATQKHVTQAFGLMLGCDAKSLPDLSNVVQIEQAFGGVDQRVACPLFVHWPISWLPIVAEFHKQFLLESTVVPADVPLSVQERFRAVLRAPMVIGPQSFETYVAASLGITTVELCSTKLHRRWLSKWAAKSYEVIYGTEYVTPERVLIALRTACRRLALAASRPALVETRMEQSR